jgi:DNA-binding SARP family transcriptional activator
VSISIHLAGPLEVTAAGTRFEPGDFPGRQGRIVFAALAFSGRPVDRNELADILWPNRLPASWTRDLSAIVSKIRALLTGVADVVTGGGRWYALELPANARVDTATAVLAVERAERARAADGPERALRETAIATMILSEPFLAGDECPWVDERRAELRDVLARALVVRTEVLCDASSPLAIPAAHALVELAPENEQGHLLLMRAHDAMGDRVEVLRSYERLRKMLADDFGLLPSIAADELMRAALGPDDVPTPTRPTLALPAAVVDARRTRIFGREAELKDLVDLFADDAVTRLAVVVGPAGIGKSRLACEAAARAHELDFVVLYGAGNEGPTTPYRVIIDAFTAVGLTPDVDDRFARVAYRVVEQVASHDVVAPETERPRPDMLAAIAAAVSDFAGSRTLLLVVDDAHWADAASVRVLEQLLQVVPQLRVIATARAVDLESADIGALLVRLRTKDRASVVTMRGLELADVAAALAEQGVHTPESTLVHAVHSATGGNPLYVREIGRHLAVASPPARVGDGPLLDAIGLPRGLAELIDANVARLGAPARRVLEVCAVIGGSIEVGVVARASGLPQPELLAAIEVARRAGVLVESSTDGATLRFDHPLVREVIFQGLGAARRAQLHQRVAEAIEAYHHDDVDRFSAELAHHLATAANVGSARDAIEFAVRAGERAEAVCAYDEAVHWLSHALRLARERDDHPDTVVRLLTALGSAQNHGGDARGAHAVLLEAVAAARVTQNPEPFARAVLRLGGVLVDAGHEGGAVDQRLVLFLEECLAQLSESSPLRAQALVRLATELHFAGNRDRCLALCTEAETIARNAGDTDALAAVFSARHYALYGAPDVHARLALVAEIQALRTVARPQHRWLRDYLELGDMQAVEAAAAHLDRQIATSGIASDRYYPAVWRATEAALRRDLDVAEAAANDAAEIGRSAARGPEGVAGVWAAQIFAVRLFDGRLAELRDLIDAAADATPARPIWRAAAAFMHLELQELDRAETHLGVLRRAGFSQLPHTVDRPLTLAMLSWVAAEIGSLADARELRRQLRPYGDVLIVLGTAAPSVCAGPMAYPLAVLEGRLGRTDAAHRLFTQAESQAEQIGARRWRDRIRRSRARIEQPEARVALT